MALILAEPACEIGCPRCEMDCAILPERIAWWEAQIADAYQAGDIPRAERGGMAHAMLVQRLADSPRRAEVRLRQLN